MEFKEPGLEFEFGVWLHPEVRALVLEFDTYATKERFPKTVVTHVVRSDKQSEEYYYPYLKGLIERLKSGAPLTTSERAEAVEIRDASDLELHRLARTRFSWHKVACAVDLRNRHYSPQQRQAAADWFKARCTSGPWRFLAHDVGRGDHFHLERRDFAWREGWKKQQSVIPEGKKWN